jgi:hypothetical protein
MLLVGANNKSQNYWPSPRVGFLELSLIKIKNALQNEHFKP